MITGGSNVWFNFSYGSRIDTPNGCLLNPEGSCLIFFERCRKSSKNSIEVFVHYFYTNHFGEPAGLKSSNLLNLDSAYEKWDDLIKKGWTEIHHQYG